MFKRFWQPFAVISITVLVFVYLFINIAEDAGKIPLFTTRHESPRRDYAASVSENQPEIQQVVFAKVHKAASSTVQNILLRFALARELDLLLPVELYNINEGGKVIVPSKIIRHPLGKPFDILCNHLVYDASEIDDYFPRTAVRVTMLREPLQQALSALWYYSTVYPQPRLKAGVRKHRDDPINGFLAHPEDFYPPKLKCKQPGSFINNRMSFDLGFYPQKSEAAAAAGETDTARVKQFLTETEKQFDLVLISEYFDESMVLLRRSLRWGMKDIIYLKVNVAKTKNDSKWHHKPIQNTTLARTFRHCNRLDYELYEHFLPIFLQKIRKEHLFHEEVAYFKELKKTVSNFCRSNQSSEFFHVPGNAWSKNFTVSKSDCKLMSLTELEFVDMAKKTQLKRYKRLKAELSRNRTRIKNIASIKSTILSI